MEHSSQRKHHHHHHRSYQNSKDSLDRTRSVNHSPYTYTNHYSQKSDHSSNYKRHHSNIYHGTHHHRNSYYHNMRSYKKRNAVYSHRRRRQRSRTRDYHHHHHYYRHDRNREYRNHNRHKDKYYLSRSSSRYYSHSNSKCKSPSSRSYSSKNNKSYSSKQKISQSSSESGKGHYNYTIGEVINEKYKLIKFLGDGTFGRVMECQDITNNKFYAMKIIRPVTKYIESAEIEAKIIIDINKHDFNKKSHCIQIIEAFPFHSRGDKYYAMIFEKVGLSLFEFIKMNKYRGYTISDIQSFAYQILEGIGYLHAVGIIHTDLKPENILLVDSSYKTIINKSQWPSNVNYKEEKMGSSSPSTRSLSKEKEDGYNKINNAQIKIIDFGGAVYTTENCSGIINTRQYRSPEVILECCRWNEKSDVWSIACILAELYTGELLFSTHDNEEHLTLIEKVAGEYPSWMASNSDPGFSHLFERGRDKVGIDFHKLKAKEKVIKGFESQDTLDDLILEEHKLFRDFLKKLLIIDPNLRPSCIEAMKHDFFKYSYKE